MTTYHISNSNNAAPNDSFSTGSAKSAASVACAWKRNGWDVAAYVIHDDCSTAEVAVTTANKTAKALVDASRAASN